MSSKRSLRHATKRTVHFKDVTRIIKHNLQGNDRESVIVIGTAIEAALEAYIKTRFTRLRIADQNSIFDGTGPLSTFSAKIDVGFALGLFGSKTRHDLKTIKDIRNLFAHSHTNVTFRNKKIASRVEGMYIVQRNIRTHYEKDDLESVTVRDKFDDAARIYLFLFKIGGAIKSRQTFLSSRMGDLAY